MPVKAKTLASVFLSLILGLAVASPATPSDLGPVVTVSIVELTPKEEASIGEKFVYMCKVDGPVEDFDVQWQSSKDGIEWEDIDCHEMIYAFILDEENAQLYHRVMIIY